MDLSIGWNSDGPYLEGKNADGTEWAAPQWAAGILIIMALVIVVAVVLTGLGYWFNYFIG